MSTEIALSNRGVLRPTTMGEILEFAKLASRSAFVPPAYRNKPEDTFIAMQMGAELGLSPIQSLQSIAVINGRPAVYGDALLALVLASPLCIDVIEAIKGSGENQTAVCDARRKGREPVVRSFSIADAKQAKLWGKAGPWTDYPLVMLKHRARGFALRDAFPDLLRGLISAEEAADIPREPKDITPQSPQSATALADALDAFAADDAVEPEPPIQRPPAELRTGLDDGPPLPPENGRRRRAPEEPTEAEIERSQERIADVLGPEEMAKLDEENLLFAGRAAAFDGRKSFGGWYASLTDDQRLVVRPHLGKLQHAARAADGRAPAESEDAV